MAKTRTNGPKNQTFDEKFWEDGHGNVVLWQKPNIWLTTWFITTVATWFINTGWLDTVVGLISLLSLIIWAVLEAYSGINYFRRTIGALVLLSIIMSRLITLV